MNEVLENCNIGLLAKTECHLSSYTQKKCIHKLESVPEEDTSLLKFRIDDYHRVSKGTICEHHKKLYLDYFSSFKYKCCDPFKKHKKNINTNLRILKLEICKSALEILLLKLAPGDKVL